MRYTNHPESRRFQTAAPVATSTLRLTAAKVQPCSAVLAVTMQCDLRALYRQGRMMVCLKSIGNHQVTPLTSVRLQAPGPMTGPQLSQDLKIGSPLFLYGPAHGSGISTCSMCAMCAATSKASPV